MVTRLFLFAKSTTMKLKFLSLLLFLSALSAYAEDAQLIIKQKSGNETVLELSSNPIITFEGEDMVVTNDVTTFIVPLSDVDDYVFNTTPTNIQRQVIEPTLHGSHLIFRGLPHGAEVNIYSVDGKRVGTQNADGIGSADVDLSKFPKGTFIIGTSKNRIKIINK